jgi:hypothetical protein
MGTGRGLCLHSYGQTERDEVVCVEAPRQTEERKQNNKGIKRMDSEVRY